MRPSLRLPALALCLLVLATGGFVPRARAVDPLPGAAMPAQTTAERATDLIDAALQARNPDTRKLGVEALGLVGPREPFKSALRAMVGDKDIQVRIAVVDSLTDLRDDDTVPLLHELLADPVPEVAYAAAKALWSLGDVQGRDALIEIVAGRSEASSGYFAKHGRETLRMFYTPKAVLPYLLGRGVGFAHVAGLGLGIASLQGLLSDPSISGRAAGALMLSNDPDPRVLLALREALADKDPSVRAAAVHAIALRDDPSLEPDLLPFLDDPRETVRLRAAAGCLRLELILPPPPPAVVVPPVAPPTHRRPHR